MHGAFEEPVGFDEKGENLYVAAGLLTQRIDRLNLSSGQRTLFKQITPADPTGVAAVATIQLTPDGRSYCYSYMRSLSRLYVVEGLR